jgi:hypothetical protein
LNGRARLSDDGAVRFIEAATATRAEKFRRAYDWIATRALIAPYHDMEFGTGQATGVENCRVHLPGSTGYASFVLMPILNLLVNRRLVFVGGPGRGKTTMATLMALLAGAPLDEVRKAVQHGHPQLTLADLLGGPLPADLVKAETAEDIRVRWRHWITARVKIIDEYNRIRHVRVVPHRERRSGRRHIPRDRSAAGPHRRGRPLSAASPRLDRHARGACRGWRDAGRVRTGRSRLPFG